MFLLQRALVFCDSRRVNLDTLEANMQDYLSTLKHKYGTQMMSFPNINYQVKGDRYSLSFAIDRRRGTLEEVKSLLDQNINDTSLKRKHKHHTNVRGVDCLQYEFADEANQEFTISLVGPTNQHFYTLEYTKKANLNADLQQVASIYEEANKPREPLRRTQSPGQVFSRPDPRIQGDPIENLTALGVKVFLPQDAEFDWDCIAGYEEAKQEIEDTVMLTLEHPEIYDKITELTRFKPEHNRPRAVLFEGPPGTGKTTSAKIISHQVKIPMVYVPLEVIVSKWYGEAEKNLGTVFENCKRLGKCIIFIDEVDSLAQSRDHTMHEATRRMLSVFLRYIDGFETQEDVLVICATNRREDLDPALQSRFSKVISFPWPDLLSRVAIFKRYARHLSEDHLQQLAELSVGMAGRDIKSVCEDAERQWAARLLRGEEKVYCVDFQMYLRAVQSRLRTLARS
jgi:SpoVK/Ycf46/Vps4 family AAA+-type ATPase